MPNYRAKGPDGKTYDFGGPPGMSDKDASFFLNQYIRMGGLEPEAAPAPPPAPKPETGFVPSVKRGYAGLESLIGDVLPAMAAHAVGADEYAKKQMKEAATSQEEIAKKYPAEVPSYKDIKDVGTGFKYIVESVGEAIPSILPSLFTGGAASIIGRGAVAAARAAAEDVVMKGATAGIAEEALKKAALDAGVKAAQSTALKYEAAGALTGSAAQNIPDVYQNIYEKTGKQDLGAALAFGGFNSVLDAITPFNLMRKIKLTGIPEEQIAAAWYKRAGKGALEGLATEGGTETLQEISSAAAERLVAQHGDFFTKENFERFINAGLKGGIGGGVITGATNVAFGKGPEEVKNPPEVEGAAPSQQVLDKLTAQQPPSTEPTPTPTTAPQPTAPIGETPGFKILEEEMAKITSPEKVPTLPPQAAPATDADKLKAYIEQQKAELANGVSSQGIPLNPFAKKKKEEKIAKLEAKLTETPNAQPITPTTGTSVSVPSGPDTNVAPTPGTQGDQLPGVVPAGENAPSVVAGEAEQQAPVKKPNLSEMKPEQIKESFTQPPVPIGEAKEQKPEGYAGPNPKAPNDANSWQNKNGSIHYNINAFLENGKSKVTELIDQEQSKNIALVFEDSQGNKGKIINVGFTRTGMPYWSAGDVSEQDIKTNLGENLFNSLGNAPIKNTTEYGALVDRIKNALLNKQTKKEEPSVTETPEAIETTQEEQAAPAPEPVAHTEDQIDDYNAAAEYHNEQKGNEERQLPTYEQLTPEQKTSYFSTNPSNGEEHDEAANKLANEVHGKRKAKEAPLPPELSSMQAVIQNIRTASSNPLYRSVATLFNNLKLNTKLKFVNSLPNGRVAEYNPDNDTIYATKKGMDETVMLHELTHAATVKSIYDYINSKTQDETKGDAMVHLEFLMEQSREELGAKFPEAYKDLYEFIAHAITDAEFQKALEATPITKENSIFNNNTNAFSEFIRSIFQFLGLLNDKSNFKAEAFKAFEDIVSAPPKSGVPVGQTLGFETKQAPTAPQTDKEIMETALNQVRPMVQTRNVKSSIRNLFTKQGAQWMVERFQNDRYPLKIAEDRGVLFNIVERMGDKVNNVYGQITRSSGMAVDLFNRHMKFPVQDANEAVKKYADKRGIDIKEALAELHLILETRHEPERRAVLFMLNVPLDEVNQILEFHGKKYSAYGFRDEALRLLGNPVELEKLGNTPLQLRGMMDKIIHSVQNDVNSPFRAKRQEVIKKRGEPEFKEVDPKVFDINDPRYNVIANRTPREISVIKQNLDTAKLKAEIDDVAEKIKAVHEQTKFLNKMANYQSKPVSNVIEFYDFDHYVPFKGRPSAVTKAAEELDFDSQRLGGEMQEGQDRMEGRLSESENAVLQSLADGASAAMRAGRKDLTLSIKNAVQKGVAILQGRVVTTINFDERFRGAVDKQSIVGQNKIFHYNEDGTINIVEITDKRQSEAIRRSYRESQPIMDAINSLTSGIGQTHTRYNPAFAPMNFVRDALTNAFTIGAELGPVRAGQLLTFIATEVASGGLAKSLRYSRLYADGKFGEIKALAGGDKPYNSLNNSERYYRDLSNYVQQGGKVSYLQGVAAKGAMEQLIKEVGRSGILKKKDQIDKFIDIYNDMFELSSRVASYRFLKEEIAKDNITKGMDRAKAEADAEIQAVEYAKNLANFEQVGRWGKNAGALFMFFRPAATGAVRAIEALAPAFTRINEVEFRKNEEARGMSAKQINDALATLKARQQHARVMAAALTGIGMSMFLMASMMSGDDDQGRNKVLTDDMSRWTRYARFPIPGTDIIFQIPWGFGLGSFAAAGAQIASMFAGRTSIADGLSNIVTTGLDSFLPIPVSRISPVDNFPAWAMDSVTPSPLRPFFEYVMNLDGLGREIYNNRQTKYGDAFTGGDNIPELYKFAARELFNATNGAVDWSPNTIYFFASNYVDGMAKALTGVTNLGLSVTGQKDIDLKNDTLFLNSFFGSKSNVDAREFSKVENQIKGIEKRINALKDKPDQFEQYMQDNPTDYSLVQYYNQQINGSLKTLRSQANQIRVNKDMDIRERKQNLDEIIKMENLVKRQLLDNFESISNIKP